MINGKIQEFFDEQFGSIRSMVDEFGTIWFAGIDIAIALGYKLPDKAIRDHIKKKHTMVLDYNNLSEMFEPSKIDGSKESDRGGARRLTLIDESAVYKLIARSNMPKAEEFQDWVFEYVLPTIRRHGMYVDVSHPTIRVMSILIRNVETEAISSLIKYAKKKGVEYNPTDIYAKLSILANKVSNIEIGKRDKSDNINLCICMLAEMKIMSTIYKGIIKDYEPDSILYFCQLDTNEIADTFNIRLKDNGIDINYEQKISNQEGDKNTISLNIKEDKATFSVGEMHIEFTPEWENAA